MSKSFGRRPEQQIADAAADQIGGVLALPQAVENLERVGIDVACERSGARLRGTILGSTIGRHCTQMRH